jgi:D-hydroxyproline dehydrogenase subunit gamma
MRNQIKIRINDAPVVVQSGTTVAAAVIQAGYSTFRHSTTGQVRGPLCGIGICFECRLSIDGISHRRSCQLLCRDGMEIITDDHPR